MYYATCTCTVYDFITLSACHGDQVVGHAKFIVTHYTFHGAQLRRS